MIKPLGDRILLEVIEKKGKDEFEPSKGKVIAIGPDVKALFVQASDRTNRYLMVDDIVIYDARFGGDVVGKNLIIIREGSALAIE